MLCALPPLCLFCHVPTDQLLRQLERLQETRRQQRAEAKPGQASIPFERGTGALRGKNIVSCQTCLKWSGYGSAGFEKSFCGARLRVGALANLPFLVLSCSLGTLPPSTGIPGGAKGVHVHDCKHICVVGLMQHESQHLHDCMHICVVGLVQQKGWCSKRCALYIAVHVRGCAWSAPGSGLLNVVQLREQAERNAAALMSRGAGKRSKWDSAK
eukprot:1156338-Pelagomonas_calceolata.AAC.1